MKRTEKKLIAYTDGSAVVSGDNRGKGGYGAVISSEGCEPEYLSKGFFPTKIGRMELMALLACLEFAQDLPEDIIHLQVYSDSQYVVKSFTDNRLKNWIANGWYNSSGQVKSQDLWKRVVDILDKGKVHLDIEHVRGHGIEKIPKNQREKVLANNPHIKGNTVADILADYKRHKVYLPDIKIEEWK